MRKFYPFFLLFVVVAQAQIVTILDPVFKSALVNTPVGRDLDGNSVVVDTNGDGEIQVLEAQAIYALYLSGLTMNNMTGIKSFSNLQYLQVSNGSLGTLNVSNMTSLIGIDCADLGLTSLNVAGTTSLEQLDCSGNQLTSLTISSSPALVDLVCDHNQLVSLSVFNAPVLGMLNANNNNLTSLTLSGVTVLEAISLSYNQLTTLDLSQVPNLNNLQANYNQLVSITFPSNASNLYWVEVAHNQLASLSTPGSAHQLGLLDCSYNQLVSLYVPNGETLLQVKCHHNQLASLSIPVPELWRLDCSYNQLTSLSLAAGLEMDLLKCDHNAFVYFPQWTNSSINHLDCSFNALTNLDVSWIQNLITLDCSNNSLTSIDLGSHAYGAINCSNNLFPYLDVLSLPEVGTLDCSNNQLAYLMANTQIGSVSLAGNPNLAYVCAHPDKVLYFQTLLEELSYAAEVNSYCVYAPGDFHLIEGTQRFDSAMDGCTEADVPFPNLNFTISNGQTSATLISDENGHFSISVPVGTHTLTPSFAHPYFTISPASTTITFPDAGTIANPSFCIAPLGVHHDLRVSLLPLGAAVPGFDASYRIKVLNQGNQVENGTLVMAFDESTLDYVSSVPAGLAAEGSLEWAITGLLPLTSVEFTVVLNLNSPVENPSLDLGDVLSFGLTASNSGEETPDDNFAVLNQDVVNAVDPNDKTCLEGDAIAPEMAGNYLHYLIRFENNGNYPAINVRVEDVIDPDKFDIASLEPLDGSHAFTTRITGNKVEFIFNNIMLPFDDANNDGWVLFRIKTKPTLVLGDSVSNTAGIYFNFNPPVITNTATTTFATMGVDSHFDSSFRVWPNPANDVVNMESKRGEAITSVSVYNTLGQELLREKGSDLRNVNVSGLAAGTYVITVTTDKSKSSTQLIKK
ncbi:MULTISPECIES: T9SS type A sorting domain-containing protein [unclassified Flavobacterium]|uniref:DUF7619 domain-containing protein n=1 Tax=unclassified Flavobacterium TaxID=196869 RepID=UPI001F141353|nr:MULTISPECIES: T9SS type A sorting domain-containing protein [unclassified Flavobacterium]UMY64748.1 T9SS type A sorting domain-containing protein [Flavobacterium sp. HJ-32-4]